MILLYSLLGVLLLFILLSFFAPRDYEVHRSITINKPLEEVFQYLKLIKNQDHWSPWKLKDPNMKQTYKGTDGEVGFVARWEGNKQVGSGEQEITKIERNKRIETDLRFFKPWKSESHGFLAVEIETDNKTRVVWGFSGTNPMPYNVFMLFFNFEKAVGKDFEDGLLRLKELLEN